MMFRDEQKPLRSQGRGRYGLRLLALGLICCQGLAGGRAETNGTPELGAPNSPREFFNAGTKQLRAGKFREAEASFETALASQNARLQPPALYNLGHVRFGQGL